MKFAQLAIASAVLAIFSAPALADPPLNTAALSNVTKIKNNISVDGDVTLSGKIKVGTEVGAVTDNSQASVGNLTVTIGGGNSASITRSGNGVTGNVGVNQASGTGNAQGNEAALAALQDANSVFASAQTFSSQVSAVNANLTAFSDNRSDLTNSFNGVTGNIGVNVAAGAGNMQDNQMAAATQKRDGNYPNDGSAVKATGSNQQLVALTLNGQLDPRGMSNVSTISDSLTGSGNLAVNMAAGYGNLQHNSLSIASSAAR